MKITYKKLVKLGACQEGLDWFKANGESDLKTTLVKVNGSRPDWARWLFTRLMTRKQCIEIAIYSAEQVLNVFETKYPNDKRPRLAIKAAKAVLKSRTNKNKRRAYAAAYAAYGAAFDANAYAAYAAAFDANAYAAYAAAFDAALATSSAFAAASYAASVVKERTKMQLFIITKAVKILERDKK